MANGKQHTLNSGIFVVFRHGGWGVRERQISGFYKCLVRLLLPVLGTSSSSATPTNQSEGQSNLFHNPENCRSLTLQPPWRKTTKMPVCQSDLFHVRIENYFGIYIQGFQTVLAHGTRLERLAFKIMNSNIRLVGGRGLKFQKNTSIKSLKFLSQLYLLTGFPKFSVMLWTANFWHCTEVSFILCKHS